MKVTKQRQTQHVKNLEEINTNYKTCDKCCYDILDSEGDIMEHYCIEEDI